MTTIIEHLGTAPGLAARRERPMLFNDAMVRAIIEGRKTQTRRVVKHRFDHLNREPWFATGRVLTNLPTQSGAFMEFRYRQQDEHGFTGSPASSLVPCPYGQPGDLIWVREAFALCQEDKFGPVPDSVIYRADAGNADWPHGWRPSIHMPRNLSRILLEIVAVRVERLNDISEADCEAEGINTPIWNDNRTVLSFANAYRHLWESINAPGSWSANPFVWVVEFRRVAP